MKRLVTKKKYRQKKKNIPFVYYLPGETGLSMVCANGSRIPIWKFPFGVGVYHLNNIHNLPKELKTNLTSSKWLLRSSY